ncbi:MAG: T9SS type A sorting domain-containing protein [Brumimicrobium sp.]
MRKFYIFTLCLVFLANYFSINSQTLNQPANWPNTNWTVTGTYDASFLFSDPTASANFGYDDDAAGSGSDNTINAESPIIDLTPASGNGETWINIDLEYVLRVSSSETLSVEYFDADATTWVLVDDLTSNTTSTASYTGCTDEDAYTSSTIDISGFSATQLSGFKYRISYDDDTNYAWGFCVSSPTIYSSTPPTCQDPTALNASNITNNTADLSWTDNAGTGQWELEWGTQGFTQGSGTLETPTATTFNLTGLTQGTDYEFYVRADCGSGDFSSWVGPFTFSTVTPGETCNAPIEITSIPYTTTDNTSNYGDNYSSADRPSLGGELYVDGTGSGSYLNGDDAVYSFTPTANACYDINLSGTVDGWVGFWMFEGCEPFNSIVARHTATSGTTRSLTGVNLTAGTTYYIVISTWPAPQNTAYTLTVDECPTCLPPDNLNASNITTTSADLDWNDVNGASLWDIELGTTGFTPTGTPTDAGVSNPHNYTGLTASTTYEYYVRADCGSGDISAWEGPYSFTTECDTFNVPFLESFTNGTEPICWNSYSVSGSTSANENWKFSGGAGYGATGNGGKPDGTFAWVDGSTPASSQAVLESPVIDLSGLTAPTLSFELFSYNEDFPGDNMTFTVDIDTAGTITNLFTYTGDSVDWMLQQLDLSGFSGEDVKLIFTVDQTTTTNSAYYNDILLDEVAICEGEDGTFNYASNLLCNQESSILPNITGMTGGVFESQTGLDIDPTTGEIDPSTSTLGSYTVTYTTSTSACRAIETFDIEVVDLEDASFNYALNEACSNNEDVVNANVTGLSGGTFSAQAGLDIDASTGDIDPSNSNSGVYTIEYTSSTSSCATTETFGFEIIESEDASFEYDSTEFCLNYTNVVPSINGTPGGIFSAEPGIAINSLTGQIGTEASTPGQYWIYYTTPGTECQDIDSVQITIDECVSLDELTLNDISVYPNPSKDVLNYEISQINGEVQVVMIDAIGNLVYQNNVKENEKKQQINVENVENGIYMIKFQSSNKSITKRVVIAK